MVFGIELKIATMNSSAITKGAATGNRQLNAHNDWGDVSIDRTPAVGLTCSAGTELQLNRCRSIARVLFLPRDSLFALKFQPTPCWWMPRTNQPPLSIGLMAWGPYKSNLQHYFPFLLQVVLL